MRQWSPPRHRCQAIGHAWGARVSNSLRPRRAPLGSQPPHPKLPREKPAAPVAQGAWDASTWNPRPHLKPGAQEIKAPAPHPRPKALPATAAQGPGPAVCDQKQVSGGQECDSDKACVCRGLHNSKPSWTPSVPRLQRQNKVRPRGVAWAVMQGGGPGRRWLERLGLPMKSPFPSWGTQSPVRMPRRAAPPTPYNMWLLSPGSPRAVGSMSVRC